MLIHLRCTKAMKIIKTSIWILKDELGQGKKNFLHQSKTWDKSIEAKGIDHALAGSKCVGRTQNREIFEP